MKELNFLTKHLIAHRGYHDMRLKVPENSILSFKRAIKYNYIIELDVHLLKDGKIIVFHDSNLKRMCNVNKVVENSTYEELKEYKLLGTNERIPLFTDVLNLINGKVPLLIEIKNNKLNGKFEKALAKILQNYEGEFAIQSFNPMSIYWFKLKNKKCPKGLIIMGFKSLRTSNLKTFIRNSLILDIFLKTDFVSVDVKSLPSTYIKNLRKKKNILGWTVRSNKEYEKGLKYCDNLICENMSNYIIKRY